MHLSRFLWRKQKNASGQDHGFTRMPWGGAWRIADLSAIHRVRGEPVQVYRRQALEIHFGKA